MAIERIVPGTVEWEAYYQNHITRYEFAAKRLRQKQAETVLDAACGVGYGSEYLCKQISSVKVIGIDRSDDALAVANKYFKNDNNHFLQDDCHTLHAAAAFGLFDAIVSFETLEHLPNPEKFAKNAFGNLKNKGTLIISTPNQLVTSPNNNLNWKYHEKEYKPEELIQTLEKAGFNEIELYGQRLTLFGRFRQQIRAELNIIHSNPYIRLGIWMQKVLRNKKPTSILPEQKEEIEIVKYSVSDLNEEGVNGPFVLIAIATCNK